ncbi:MAG TPA: uroporphyrinogen decarboxylase family protein [bacterium]|nr:uroporphyrinogen decarboxylase family protein [bacterium]
MELLPKERFKLITDHKQADRPTVDFQLSAEILEGLKNRFGVDYNELLNIFSVDVRHLGAEYIGPPLRTFPDGSREDMFGIRRKSIQAAVGNTYIETYNPLAGMKTIDDFRKGYMFPSYEYFDFERIRERIRENRKYVLMKGMIIWYLYFFLRGMEQALMDMILNEEFYHYVMGEIAGWWKGYMKRALEPAEGAIDYVITYEDFGTAEGLMVSLEDIRNKVLVYYKDFGELFSGFGARFALHSCGAVAPVIPDLLKLGVTILDPVQVSAKGMDIEVLKKTYGDRLTFRGAIDTISLLPGGTKEEVKEKVKYTVDILGKNGGYIFCSSNAVNADTPLENVLAMYEAVLGDKFWKRPAY